MRSPILQQRFVTFLCLAMGLHLTACALAPTDDEEDSLDAQAVGTDDAALHKAWLPGASAKPTVVPFVATYICGDGVLSGREACDDANQLPGDGCDPSCQVESGFLCSGEPSLCADVNECLGPAPLCGDNAVCRNLPGSYNCTCDAGFEGDGMTCTDVDECALGAHFCGTDASCVNQPGTFSCVCDEGFEGDGVACSDIDECADADACGPGAVCVNNRGGFKCLCEDGYEGADGDCTDIDECANGATDCSPDADCINRPGGYECACREGWKGDGLFCEYTGD